MLYVSTSGGYKIAHKHLATAPLLWWTLRPMVYWDTFSDADSDSSSDDSSTASLDDEDEINARCSPNWEFYRSTLLHHGFQLDTVKDVKQFYERYWSSGGKKHLSSGAEYARACAFQDENALCKDPGLVSTP